MRTQDRSTAIDFLRGVAVFVVMCSHLPFSYGPSASPLSFPSAAVANVMSEGHWGVQLFLVISGYSIHVRWARAANLDTRVEFVAFWKRRLLRLYPPYAVIVLVAAAATWFATRGGAAGLSGLMVDVLVLLLLVQNLTDASQHVGNGPFWSLALEEQLYLLYFPLLEIRRRVGWLWALLVPAAVSLAWHGAVLARLLPLDWHPERAGPEYWLAWALGALVAESHHDHVAPPAWSKSVLPFLVLFPVAVYFKFPFYEWVASASFFFLVHAMVSYEKRKPLPSWTRPVVVLGEISYGVYLVHNIAFVASKRLLAHFAVPNAVMLVARLGAGLLAGYIVYRLLETPFLERARRIVVPLRSSPVTAQKPAAVRTEGSS